MSDTEFTLDFSETDIVNPPQAGNKCTKPGKATLLLTSCTPKTGNDGSPYLAVTFDIAAHADPSQVNLEFYQSMNPNGKYAHKVTQLAMALGLLTAEDIAEKALNPSKSFTMDFTKAYGNLVCGEITQKGEYKPKIWDFFGPNDPAAAGYPKPAGLAAPAPASADKTIAFGEGTPREKTVTLTNEAPAVVPAAVPPPADMEDDDIPF
jgi:hypothetical protein